MAELKMSDEEGRSWWNSWLQSAKEQSTRVLEFMKKDLNEFKDTVQTDTAATVYGTASLIKEKLNVDESITNRATQSINSLLGTITEAFTPIREPDENEVLIIKNSEPVMLDRWQSQLHAIRTDPRTFSHEPDVPPDIYESWLEYFSLDDYQEEISNMVINYSEVRLLYAKLVPTSISHEEFWKRYFFRVHQLDEAESRIAELLKRTGGTNKEISWDEDDDAKENLIRNPSVEKLTSKKTADCIENANIDSQNCCNDQTSKDVGSNLDTEIASVDLAESSCENKNSNGLLSEKQEESSIIELFTPKDLKEKESPTNRSPALSTGTSKDGSNEDDWEKDFDLDNNEVDIKKITETKPVSHEEEDEWESWE